LGLQDLASRSWSFGAIAQLGERLHGMQEVGGLDQVSQKPVPHGNHSGLPSVAGAMLWSRSLATVDSDILVRALPQTSPPVNPVCNNLNRTLTQSRLPGAGIVAENIQTLTTGCLLSAG